MSIIDRVKVPSGHAYPAQHYVVTPLSFFALLCSVPLFLLAKLRWLFLPALVIAMAKYLNLGWVGAIIVALFYHFYLLPGLMNAEAMAIQHFAPPRWEGPFTHSGLTGPRPVRLILSQLALLSAGVTIAGTAFTRVFHPDRSIGRALAAAFLVLLFQIIFAFGVLLFESTRCRTRILLCRRFDEKVTMRNRAGLIPVLGALGEVVTLFDETIESKATEPPDPQGGPSVGFSIDVIRTDDETNDAWKTKVRGLMTDADLIVIDISSLSRSIAWELAEGVGSRGAQRVILVGAIQFLQSPKGRQIHFDLRRQLTEVWGESVAENTIKAIAAPLAYSDDFSNLIFAWRICRWHPEEQSVFNRESGPA